MKVVEDFDVIAIDNNSARPEWQSIYAISHPGKYRSPLFATIHLPHPMF